MIFTLLPPGTHFWKCCQKISAAATIMFVEKTKEVCFGLCMVLILSCSHPSYVSIQASNFIVFETVKGIVRLLLLPNHPGPYILQTHGIAFGQDSQTLPDRLTQHWCIKPHTLIGVAVGFSQLQNSIKQLFQADH